MEHELVEQPIPAPEAFAMTGDHAAQSQAALLLLLGQQLRGDRRVLRARARAAGVEGFVESLPAEVQAQFPVPQLAPASRRIPRTHVRSLLTRRYGAGRLADAPVMAGGAREAKIELCARLYQTPGELTAAQLMEVCLGDADPLVRAAAAASYYVLCDDPRRIIRVLAECASDPDPLAGEVAATALARVEPMHPVLHEWLSRPGPPPAAGPRTFTASIVHGTWARTYSWWQSGGDFYNYLAGNVRSDVYGAPDRFEWSGGYSPAARDIAGQDLLAWANGHGLNPIDLFTHSHGGSVAMLASQLGLGMDLLVLMACPVHAHKYLPDFSRVRRTVSVRVNLDLVILADGGGQKYAHPRIHENVLPIWFDHSAAHDPAVWQRYNVPSML